MILQPCRSCGQQVSTAALVCPHCGLQKPTPFAAEQERSGKRTLGAGCLGVSILIVVLVILGLAISPNEQSDPLAGLCAAAQDGVRQKLRAPSTARFGDTCKGAKLERTGRYMVTGEVDAENAFGAHLRGAWVASVSGSPGNWHVEDAYISTP